MEQQMLQESLSTRMLVVTHLVAEFAGMEYLITIPKEHKI
jgi:hypothetical protein